AAVTGTINLQDQISIYDDIEIRGPGAPTLTLAADNNEINHRIFYLYAEDRDFPVTISGLTMTGGSPGGQFLRNAIGGAILDMDSTLTLSDSVVTGNEAFLGGGLVEYGFYTQAHGENTHIDHTTFSYNEAFFGGGAI